MRILIAPLAFAALALAACTGGDSEQTKVLKAAMEFFGDDPKLHVPPVGNDYQCGINGAKVQDQGATPYPAIGGICRWDIEQQANAWHVTFAEAWECGDFSLEVPGYPSCSGDQGSHVWEWLVSEDLQVVPLGDRGNYAPDMPQ